MACHILRWLGIATLLIGYPLLAHHTNESAHIGNLVALVFIAGYRVRQRALPDMQHTHSRCGSDIPVQHGATTLTIAA
jgi:hypothetical protein